VSDPKSTEPVPVRELNLQVYLSTNAEAVVPVTVTVADLEKLAEDFGVPVEALTYEDIRELVVDRAHNKTPTLGICCSGGYHRGEASLELGDVWETADERDGDAKLHEIFTVQDDA
jgi:hypothetical protein